MSTAGLIAVVVVLVVVGVAGTVLRARSGRVRAAPSPASAPDGWGLAGLVPGGDDRVLLLQLSSPVCTPCRQTAGVLTTLVADTPGLRHVEVDVAERVDVARTLGVLRTPTTVAFARDGSELLRVSGVPRADELREALTPR